MREVSTRACETLLVGLVAERILPMRWLRGLPVRMEVLRDPTAWIDWDLYVDLLDRYDELCGWLDSLERAGARLPADPTLKANVEVTSVFPDLRQLYEQGGLLRTSLYYTHVKRRFEPLRDGRFRVTFEIPLHYRGSENFFRLRTGTLQAIPVLVGLPHAHVEAEITAHRGVYHVTPPRRSLVSQVFRQPDRRAALDWCVDQLLEQACELQAARGQCNGVGAFPALATAEGVDLVRVIDRLEGALRALLEPEVHLDVQCDAGTPPARVDLAELQQFLLDLALDAKSAVGQGTLGLTLAERPAVEPGAASVRLRLVAAPDGQRAPAASASRDRMSMWAERVRQWGGRFTVRDEPGLGVMYQLDLPQGNAAIA